MSAHEHYPPVTQFPVVRLGESDKYVVTICGAQAVLTDEELAEPGRSIAQARRAK